MALGFISCIALLVLADRITKERKFSEEENRMLATKPKASVETVMSGKFMSQYEKYKSEIRRCSNETIYVDTGRLAEEI